MQRRQDFHPAVVVDPFSPIPRKLLGV
eukprot:COSAG06_NODE_31220_length_525_cov_0.793427_2_plen_26_part_01